MGQLGFQVGRTGQLAAALLGVLDQVAQLEQRFLPIVFAGLGELLGAVLEPGQQRIELLKSSLGSLFAPRRLPLPLPPKCGRGGS
jgi:hypothetical protein